VSEPKRYKPAIDWDITGYEVEGVSMDEVKDGKWVSYSDYARLKAEVERLTKAGDALAREAIRLEYSNYWSEYEKVEDVCIDEVDAWHAAKGVQS
jgi:hypothetical protein